MTQEEKRLSLEAQEHVENDDVVSNKPAVSKHQARSARKKRRPSEAQECDENDDVVYNEPAVSKCQARSARKKRTLRSTRT